MSKNNRNTAKKQAAKEEKRQKTRRIRLTVLAAVAALAVILAVALLLSSIPRYAVIEGENGRYRDRETGIVYLAAPLNYEPASRMTKAYGKRGDYFVYSITGQSTDQWLTEDRGGVLQVYYSEGTVLPTLEAFEPDTVRVDRDEAFVSHLAILDKPAEVASIVDTMLNGEEAELPVESTAVYTLRITSSRYTWLTYSLAYVVTEEGNYYCDRSTDRAVKADGLVEAYLTNGGAGEEAS